MTHKTIITLLAVSILLLMGCLSPSKMIPETCKGASDMPCLQKANVDIQGNTLIFLLRNNVGVEIILTGVQSADNEYHDCINGAPGSGTTVKVDEETYTIASDEVPVEDGKQMLFTLMCTNDLGEDRLSQDLIVSYMTPDEVMQKALITIKAKP